MDIKHFRDAAEFRRWLEKRHDSATEIWIGFYRKGCGKTGMSYPEALDQALCYGWIDGIRKKVDDISYTNRFTPRTKKSIWSAINIRRVGELMKQGLMAPPGIAAFKARDPKQTQKYSFENRSKSLPPALEKLFKANTAAWAFWEAQPPGYRRIMTWYVISAVKDETRRTRLARVIEESARGRRIGVMSSAKQAPAKRPARG